MISPWTRRGVAVTPGRNSFWHGAGTDVLATWDAFKELAAEPPDNPVMWEEFLAL